MAGASGRCLSNANFFAVSRAKSIFAIPLNLLCDLTKRVLMANCLYSSQERAAHENPTAILPENTDGGYLRVGGRSSLWRRPAGRLREWDQNRSHLDRHRDERSAGQAVGPPA